ncbi:MAG: 2-polyprenylphenol 6-hydroxylase [Pseudomonadota bacterium]
MLRSLRNVWRLFGVVRTLARYDAFFIFEQIPALTPFMWPLSRLAKSQAKGRPGERLADALTEMGPSFIKLGQSLATRADLLGTDVAEDLSALQDRLPPFAFESVRATIEQEFEQPLEALFSSFEQEPVAAASIAQVHFAMTTADEAVAVKILRPGIERRLDADLDFFLWMAELIERIAPKLKRFRMIEAVELLATTTRREVDLRLEAAAAGELAENCFDDPGFRVPKIDWLRTSTRVITLERVHGIASDEREALEAAGHDVNVILQRAVEIFFQQVFRDGFFHADMHPGNMFIDAEGDLVPVDFGIMGRLDIATRRYLAEMLVGFLTRNYAMVADVHFRAGYVPPDQDKLAFRQACRAIGEPILDLPLNEISIGRLLGQLLVTTEEFEMETQPQLLLLQKTMVVAEGVGRSLNPNINMWQLAEPLVEDWMRRNLGPMAVMQTAIEEAGEAARRLPILLRRVDQVIDAWPQAPNVKAQISQPGYWRIAAIFLLGLLLGAIFI